MAHDAYDITDDYGLNPDCPQVGQFVAAVEVMRDLLTQAGLTDKGYNEPLDTLTEQWAVKHEAACRHCKPLRGQLPP